MRIDPGVCRLIANHLTSFASKTHQKSGAFPPPALPGFGGTMTLSDSRVDRMPYSTVEAATLIPHGPPLLTRHLSRRAVPLTPMDRPGCVCRLLPRFVLPSPFFGRVGVHDFLFEACSGFTHVTARRFARPP